MEMIIHYGVVAWNYLKAIGLDVWLSIVNTYKIPKNPLVDLENLFMPS